MAKICFFNGIRTWGGGEKWHYEMSQHLHHQGHEVLVITNNNSALQKQILKTDVNNLCFKLSNLSFLNPVKVNLVARELKKYSIDSIVINSSSDLKIAGLAAKKAGITKIIYVRAIPAPIKNSFLNRYYFKNVVTHIIANSKATKKAILKNNANLFPEKGIQVIYNPINTKKILAESLNPIYEKQNNHEIVISSIGRIEYEKNHEILIKLGVELKKRELLFKIVIAGEGSLKKKLIKQAQKHNLTNEVKFLGYVKNPGAIIASSDIFILPSLWEGFGYVLAEASFLKKPIIAFKTTSIPEVVVHKKTGIIVPNNDLSALTNAVETLAKNKDLRIKMGEAGHTYVINNFADNITLPKIESFIVS